MEVRQSVEQLAGVTTDNGLAQRSELAQGLLDAALARVLEEDVQPLPFARPLRAEILGGGSRGSQKNG